MKLSRNGARLIETFEGFVGHPYRDVAGVWTIGFGSTAGVGPNTRPMTRAQAEARMMREVEAHYGAVINGLGLPLNQNQFDALVTFVYNVGPEGVSSKTTVGKRLRAHDWRGAADALLAWDKARNPTTGRIESVPGLTRRREVERALFLKPVPKRKTPTKAKASPPAKYVLIDDCPCPRGPAPYVARVLKKAGQQANSIYRGDDAKALLHAHGKSTQAEIHKQFPAISNPPGFSSHELRGDGTVGTRGAKLPDWMIGVDSGTDSPHDAQAIEAAARSFGWVVHHPYARGVERHHWGFKTQPKARNPVQRAHLALERARMPKR